MRTSDLAQSSHKLQPGDMNERWRPLWLEAGEAHSSPKWRDALHKLQVALVEPTSCKLQVKERLKHVPENGTALAWGQKAQWSGEGIPGGGGGGGGGGGQGGAVKSPRLTCTAYYEIHDRSDIRVPV